MTRARRTPSAGPDDGTPSTKVHARGERTRELILDAAEQLFAERGVSGVSLREIRLAAEQRNSSAIQFHFGDVQGLMLALTQRHMPRIGSIAAESYREHVARGRGEDPKALTDVLVGCYADYIELGPGERAWVRVASVESARPRRLHQDYEAHSPPAFIQAGTVLLTNLQTFLPPDLAIDRIMSGGQMGLFLCAGRAQALDATGDTPRRPILEAKAFKTNLIEMVSAAMLAPHPGTGRGPRR